LEPEARVVRLLERRAILGFGEERYVFIEQDGRAVRKMIRVRDVDSLRVEVLAGVEAGDQALVGPELPRVTDGAPVRVRTPVAGASRVAL
jgi:hypothetical protein